MRESAVHSYSAGGIVTCNGEVLLVCENGNFFGFAKGRIESGERDIEAAMREIREETGLWECKLVRKLGSYERHPFTLQNQLDTTELKHITMFLFATDSTILGIPEEDTTVGRWISKNEVYETLTHPEDKAFYASVERLI